jgi:hypothetical protein
MPTLSDMIDEVRSSLAGYTLRQDRITYLNTAILSTDTAIPIGSSANLAKGIIEIDDELIWIDNFSSSQAAHSMQLQDLVVAIRTHQPHHTLSMHR